jgi:hypothetical protein
MFVTDMIVGISGGLLLLIGFIFFLRLLQAWMLHRTLRDAIQRDSSIAPTLVDRIGRDLSGPRVTRGSDDRTGLVLVALGIALAGFSLIVGDPEGLRYGLGAALFPALVGAALLVRHYLLRRRDEADIAGGI